MRRACVRPLTSLVFAALLTTVPGQAEADWHFTPFFGWTFKGATTLSEVRPGASRLVHWNFGGAVSVVGRGPLGGEAYFVYTPSFFTTSDPPPPNAPAGFQ